MPVVEMKYRRPWVKLSISDPSVWREKDSYCPSQKACWRSQIQLLSPGKKISYLKPTHSGEGWGGGGAGLAYIYRTMNGLLIICWITRWTGTPTVLSLINITSTTVCWQFDDHICCCMLWQFCISSLCVLQHVDNPFCCSVLLMVC